MYRYKHMHVHIYIFPEVLPYIILLQILDVGNTDPLDDQALHLVSLRQQHSQQTPLVMVVSEWSIMINTG